MTQLSQSFNAAVKTSLAITLAMTCASALDAAPKDKNEVWSYRGSQRKQTLTQIPEPFVGTWVNETKWPGFILLIKADSLMLRHSQKGEKDRYTADENGHADRSV